MSNPIWQFLSPLLPLLLSIHLFSLFVSLFLLCKWVHLYDFSRLHIKVIFIYFSFWLHFMIIVSRSIDVSANGTILFLFYGWVVIHCIYMKSESEVAQSCLALCDPMDCSLPGSTIHGIFQARILEWVAISFSRKSSHPRKWTWVSHIVGRCFTIWVTREDLTCYQFGDLRTLLPK